MITQITLSGIIEDKSYFGFNSSLKNGVVLEELLFNNYSFKRSGVFVKEFSQKRYRYASVLVNDIHIIHDDCEISHLHSFLNAIIDKSIAKKIQIKTFSADDSSYVYLKSDSGKYKEHLISSSDVPEIFSSYLTGIIIGLNCPDEINLGYGITCRINDKLSLSSCGQLIKYTIRFQDGGTLIFSVAFSKNSKNSHNAYSAFGVNDYDMFDEDERSILKNKGLVLKRLHTLYENISFPFLDRYLSR